MITPFVYVPTLRHFRRSFQIMANSIKYLRQDEAIAVDQELFNDYRFSVDQLMELAGKACAVAIANEHDSKRAQALILVGPGNNGGDGLVAARHLQQYNFDVSVYLPKAAKSELMERLLHQVKKCGINVLDVEPDTFDSWPIIIDALFGFSFKPPVRQPYDRTLDKIRNAAQSRVACIDIPSGWDVENGPATDDAFKAKPTDILISLTAPKQCARHWTGTHYLGGRFVPDALARKYDLRLPTYPEHQDVLKLS